MRVTFLLPGHYTHPIGGYKVIYEYANGLQARGHDVTLVFPPCENVRRSWDDQPLGRRYRGLRWSIKKRLSRRPLVPWFPLSPGVRLRTVPFLDARFVPDGDAVFATAWETAAFVHRYPESKGRKYYLIQHFETWDAPEDEVRGTWTLPLHKVVIARWLRDMAVGMGEGPRTTHIPNGLDQERFHITVPATQRNGRRVGMLHHHWTWKGTADGLAALTTARTQMPDMEAVLFGTSPRHGDLPAWIEYHQSPAPAALVALYNSCGIFLHPSWSEGLPAPPAEAMLCGCAVVAAANPGVLDYAAHGETALLAPVQDSAALSAQLLRLMQDDPLRQRLAAAGREYVSQFTWARAVDAMDGLLLNDHEDQHHHTRL